MKKCNLFNLKAFFLGLMVVALAASCKKDQKAEDELAGDIAQKLDIACECEDSWFPHTQTPAPAEGKGSPFDTASTTNCIFHQWSWQKFLWLTKPESNKNPLFLNQMTQVNSNLFPVKKVAGTTLSLMDIEQAGSNGILRANPAYSAADKVDKDYVVYYSIHSNDIMLSAAKRFKDSIRSGKLGKDNFKMFPVGSLELKVSWIDANTIASKDREKFFTTMAAVSKDSGKTYVNRKVALLGMHVVGVVINHPEFIWATFQHKEIGPVFDWKLMQADSAEEKLLYSKGAVNDIGGITWGTNSPLTPNKAFDLFQYGVPRNKGGDFMTTCESGPINFGNVEAINKCVTTKLDDVWNNYFYNGSIWLDTDGLNPKQQAEMVVSLGKNGGTGSALPNAKARGSLNNANITMETYTQASVSTLDSINNGNLSNCFSCHNAQKFTKPYPDTYSPLYLSHAFLGYLYKSEGKTDQQIESIKNEDFKQNFLLKKQK